MHKGFSFGVVAGLVATSALAADLPSFRAPPIYTQVAPAFTWTGFYVGGQVGYEFGQDSLGSPAFPRAPQTSSYDIDGVVGGVHVGYNWSSQGLFGNFLGARGIVGLEADVNGSSYSRDAINTVTASGRSPTGTRSPVDGSVRARIGFAVDRALFYATGGGAIASITNMYLPVGPVSLGHTKVGWTLGGGVEYAVDNKWSIRAEYRYTDYGKYADFPALDGRPRFEHETDNRVQVGLSYRFNPSMPISVPVVAAY